MRIVIIEDDPLLLENLTLLLRGEEGITVSGSYRSAEDAMTAIRSVQPEVMLTDPGLPGMSGVELIGAFVPGRVTKFPKIRWDYRIPAVSIRRAYNSVEVLHSPVAV